MSRESPVGAGNEGGSRAGDDDESRARMDVEEYLRRIGVEPETVGTPNLETLRRLHRAHVAEVPFENLAVVGDPYGDREGEGVVLSLPHLYEKIVERNRGGYCFELNGLFNWLLDELGYDVDRAAARILKNDSPSIPAAHLVNVVRLDRRYVADVGLARPIRCLVPVLGAGRSDETGIAWRVVESDRPDEEFRMEARGPDDDEWTGHYVFSDVPRELRYFEATCDYLQSAPESPFTGGPVVTVTTESGYRKLSADTLTEITPVDERERSVSPEEWHATLRREFGLEFERR